MNKIELWQCMLCVNESRLLCSLFIKYGSRCYEDTCKLISIYHEETIRMRMGHQQYEITPYSLLRVEEQERKEIDYQIYDIISCFSFTLLIIPYDKTSQHKLSIYHLWSFCCCFRLCFYMALSFWLYSSGESVWWNKFSFTRPYFTVIYLKNLKASQTHVNKPYLIKVWSLLFVLLW